MSVPLYQNAGPSDSNAGVDTVLWPNGHSRYDILVLPVQTSNQPLPSAPPGMFLIDGIGTGTPATAGAVRLEMYWMRATSSAMAAIAIPDSGDHQYWKPFLLRGCARTGNPFDTYTKGIDAALNLALAMAGPATTVDDCLVFFVAANGIDDPANNPNWSGEAGASVSNIIERHDETDGRGTGGGFVVYTAEKGAFGATETLTATGAVATADAWMAVAFRPHVSPLSAPRADNAPWAMRGVGAGGAWTEMAAGPTGIVMLGSDLGGAYESRDDCDAFECIGQRLGMNTPHTRGVGFHPTDAAKRYVGSEHGIYYTETDGASWSLASDDFYVMRVRACAGAPDRVYAVGHLLFNSPNALVRRSEDGGKTWAAIAHNLPADVRLVKLLVHPTDPNVAYVLSSRDPFNTVVTYGIWLTTDGGVTWVPVGGPVGNTLDMAMDPSAPDTLYATNYIGDVTAIYTGETWKTVNRGGAWVKVSDHTGAVLVNAGNPSNVLTIDTRRDPGHAEDGVWETLNAGGLWARKSTFGELETGYVGSAQWGLGGNIYAHAYSVGQSLLDPDVFFITTAQYLYRSDDFGLSIIQCFSDQPNLGYWITRGAENTAVEDLAFSPVVPSFLLTSYFDLGLRRSLDGGRSHQSCNSSTLTGAWDGNGGSGLAIVHDPTRAGVCWVSIGETADQSQICKSTNYAHRDSWVPASVGPTLTFIRGLSLVPSSPSSNRTLFCCAGLLGDVHKSPDDGDVWSVVLAALGCRHTAVDPTNANRVFAGGEGGLRRSENGGGAWVQIGGAEFVGALGTHPLKDIQWTGVQWIHVDAAGTVYVAIYGVGKGIYRSTDHGDTFTKILADDFSRCVISVPGFPLQLYASSSKAYKAGGTAGSSSGLQRTKDGGLSWEDINGNLPFKFAGPIAVDPSNVARVFVGSPGNGYFERTFGSVFTECTGSSGVMAECVGIGSTLADRAVTNAIVGERSVAVPTFVERTSL